jgi:hypothetical protein
LVSNYNLPIKDELNKINNIKTTISDSIKGIYCILLMKDKKLIDNIIRHDIIRKIHNYNLIEFDVLDITPIIQIILNILKLEDLDMTEVKIDEKRKF